MSPHVNMIDFVKIMRRIWYVLTKSKLEHDPVSLVPYYHWKQSKATQAVYILEFLYACSSIND